jgi:type IV pilus assembly protein PilN
VIRINLLPHREEKRKARREQFYALSGLMLVLGLVIWFLGFTLVNGYISGQESKNQYLKSQISDLDKQIDEIKKLKEQTEALLARKQVIESLQANRAETVYLFNELAKQVPTGIYLRSVKQNGMNVSLSGYSQSSARVSQLMRNLEESPLLEKARLVEIKATTVGRRRLSEFALDISITRQTADSSTKPAGLASPAGATQVGKKP